MLTTVHFISYKRLALTMNRILSFLTVVVGIYYVDMKQFRTWVEEQFNSSRGQST